MALSDAHAHILENGWMMQLPLAGSASVQGKHFSRFSKARTQINLPEVIERIKHYLKSHPDVLNDPNHWIEGMGWDQTKWEGKKFPTAVSRLL